MDTNNGESNFNNLFSLFRITGEPQNDIICSVIGAHFNRMLNTPQLKHRNAVCHIQPTTIQVSVCVLDCALLRSHFNTLWLRFRGSRPEAAPIAYLMMTAARHSFPIPRRRFFVTLSLFSFLHCVSPRDYYYRLPPLFSFADRAT